MSRAEQDAFSEATKEYVLALMRRLEDSLPELKQQRQSSPLGNDMYEAADDWRSAGNRLLNNDTRVNYQARASSEVKLLDELSASLHTKSIEQQQRYAPLMQIGRELIEVLQSVQSPKDGHLGVLRIIREQFSFLKEDYDFAVTREEPTGLYFSSGEVFLELEYAATSSLSCAFGPETLPKRHFWIEDLLRLYKDIRYQDIPWKLDLRTESDVEAWFKQIADIFKQYGKQFLLNDPTIFDLLAQAQAARDEDIERMNTGT